jgi:hypothetical protein
MSFDTVLYFMARPSASKMKYWSNIYWKYLFSVSVIVDLSIAILFIFWCTSLNFSLHWRNSKRREEATWTSPARAIRQRGNAFHYLTARYWSTIHNLAARYWSTVPTSLSGTSVLFTTSLPGIWVLFQPHCQVLEYYSQPHCQVFEYYSQPHCQVLDNSSLSGTWVLFTTSLPGTW